MTDLALNPPLVGSTRFMRTLASCPSRSHVNTFVAARKAEDNMLITGRANDAGQRFIDKVSRGGAMISSPYVPLDDGEAQA
jgi:hypothetical protein